jgi:uncharacterized protein (DUF2141 family)
MWNILMYTLIDAMNRYTIGILLVAGFTTAYTYAGTPDSSQACVTLQVKNIKQAKGIFHVSFFRSKGDFLRKGHEAFIRHVQLNGTAVQNIEICHVQSGSYAVAVLQDMDNDGDMKMSAVGTPREPFGFSNDVKPHLKAPEFSQCSFTLTPGTATNVAVTLINP